MYEIIVIPSSHTITMYSVLRLVFISAKQYRLSSVLRINSPAKGGENVKLPY